MKSVIPGSDVGDRLKSQVAHSWRTIPTGWRFLIVICMVAGIVFRVVNLDGKVYWNDETYTSLRISGYTEAQALRHLSNAGIIGVQDLQRYQYPTSPDKSVVDTIKGLAAEEPQLTPLYYVIARFWMEWFGNSVAVIRSLSAVGGLLTLPCMWWLCLELFESPLAAWIGTVILAVSPFQVLYAQSTRAYSWWAAAILLSSTMLLRAMRVRTKVSWLLYAVTLAISFYTFLFSGLVALAHAVYVIIVERFRFSKTVGAFAVALCLTILAFLPWLLVVLFNSSQADTATAWAKDGGYSLVELYKVWANHIILNFLDRDTFENLRSLTPSLLRVFPSLLYLALRILVVYAFYVLCRRTPQRIWLFVVTLTGVPALALIMADLIRGGGLSGLPRYIVPVYLGFQLAVTYLLSKELLTSIAVADWRRKLWRVATVAVIAIGFVSCVVISPADSTWVTYINSSNPKVAQIINQADRPLVISDADLGDLLSLSYYLDPKVRLLVRPQSILGNTNQELASTPYLPKIPAGFSDAFLFKPRPTPPWLSQLKQQQTYQNLFLYEPHPTPLEWSQLKQQLNYQLSESSQGWDKCIVPTQYWDKCFWKIKP
jgi:uncharacterized membrane protein